MGSRAQHRAIHTSFADWHGYLAHKNLSIAHGGGFHALRLDCMCTDALKALLHRCYLARPVRNDPQQQWQRNRWHWYCGTALHPWTDLANWWNIVQYPTPCGT